MNFVTCGKSPFVKNCAERPESVAKLTLNWRAIKI